MNNSKLILIGFLSITLVGCGADSESAFRTISNYAGHGESAPTVDDFDDAGIKGVNSRNIKLINSYIYNTDYVELDTEDELKSKLGSLGRVTGVTFMGADQKGAPTKDDYLALGIDIGKTTDEQLVNINKMLAFTKARDFLSLKKSIENLSKFWKRSKNKK